MTKIKSFNRKIEEDLVNEFLDIIQKHRLDKPHRETRQERVKQEVAETLKSATPKPDPGSRRRLETETVDEVLEIVNKYRIDKPPEPGLQQLLELVKSSCVFMFVPEKVLTGVIAKIMEGLKF